MGKSIVGVTAAFLEEAALVDLDRDISKYCPKYERPNTFLTSLDGSPAGEGGFLRTGDVNVFVSLKSFYRRNPSPTTERNLLGHRGGIQHYCNARKFFVSPPNSQANNSKINTGIEWALARFVNKSLVGIPGQAFSYSTFGFNLAAVVLEKATGKSLPDLVRKYISGPLQVCTLKPDYEWDGEDGRVDGFAEMGKTREVTMLVGNRAVADGDQRFTTWPGMGLPLCLITLGYHKLYGAGFLYGTQAT